MIKQIKKINPLFSIFFSIVFFIFLNEPIINIYAAEITIEQSKIESQIESSDVVENKSVIEEQICETPMPEVSVNKVVTNTQEEVYIDGWTNDETEIRLNPNLDATVLTTFDFNTQVKYASSQQETDWVKIEYQKDVAYLAKDCISDEPISYTEYDLPDHRDFKSYMGYNALTNTASKQYQLQTIAYTGEYGIRKVNDRYCVAIGSHFNAEIGQYFDLILENNTIIPCIMGDLKSNQHTDNQNIFSQNGCCSEFIVDSNSLDDAARNSGSISSTCEEWNSAVKCIKVYNKNIFNE